MSNDKTRCPGCDPASGETRPGCDSAKDEALTYQVGYGNPPLHSRWQPGQSGNQRGRPTDSFNLKTIAAMLAEELSESVSVQGPNGKRKMTKLRAFIKKVSNDGLTGSARDKKLFFEVLLRCGAAQAPADDSAFQQGTSGSFEALDHYVQRATRRKMLEGGAPSGEDGDSSP
jgi:hypothetical protein